MKRPTPEQFPPTVEIRPRRLGTIPGYTVTITHPRLGEVFVVEFLEPSGGTCISVYDSMNEDEEVYVNDIPHY